MVEEFEEEPVEEELKKRVVKDIDLQFNLGSGNSAEMTTDVINGVLEAIIISQVDPQGKVSVSVTFEEVPDIVVFDSDEISEPKYIPLGVQPMEQDNDAFSFGVSKWVLNNRLRVVVEGAKNMSVSLTLRII